MNRRWIAVDPAYRNTGIVVFDQQGILAHERLRMPEGPISWPTYARDCRRVSDDLQGFLGFSAAAIETPPPRAKGGYSIAPAVAAGVWFLALCDVEVIEVPGGHWQPLMLGKGLTTKERKRISVLRCKNDSGLELSHHEADAWNLGQCARRFMNTTGR